MPIRFGQFNIRDLTLKKLLEPEHPQVAAASAVIQRFRPDILSINEMEARPECPGLFSENFLQKGDRPLWYPYHYVGPTNSGVPTGLPHPFDLRGFGLFAGQYGIGLLSRFPIVTERVRSFENYPWRSSCPGGLPALLPPGFPLFSTNLLDIPIDRGEGIIHIILLHACIPVKGPFNRQRNGDQLHFLNDYISGRPLYGIEPFSIGEPFVVMGDLNADPDRGGGMQEAVSRLLCNPALHPLKPEQPTFLAGGGIDTPASDRDSFSLRLDYILPSREFTVLERGVFLPDDRPWWQTSRRASDHFFVYLDCALAKR